MHIGFKEKSVNSGNSKTWKHKSLRQISFDMHSLMSLFIILEKASSRKLLCLNLASNLQFNIYLARLFFFEFQTVFMLHKN